MSGTERWTRAGAVAVLAVVATALVAVPHPAAGQQGHPLSGSWHGEWGPPGDRTDLTVIMDWDGRQVTGLVNPVTDRAQLQNLGRAAGSALRIHEVMQKYPVLSIQAAARQTGMSEPTASSAITRMIDLGMVQEITGRPRGRIFSYGPYVSILSEGTEPIR